mmetsp:Transcript_32378/g.37084  ORF Transcript_32378/g.37084 Transcript_32378/m.37084 type:complete len:139 (-) Transcript_32378:16-432(-)
MTDKGKEEKGDVELGGSGGSGDEDGDGGDTAVAQLVPTGRTLLDPQTTEVISRMDSFFIRQRIRKIETVTCGCFEQAKVYDVFDHKTNKRIIIIKEESDGCSQRCCSPMIYYTKSRSLILGCCRMKKRTKLSTNSLDT